MSISLLIGDGMIRLSGCFTGGRFGAVDRWYWGTGGGTTAGEPRAIGYIPTEPFNPSVSLMLGFHE